MDENILVLRDVCKTFPGVKALDHVDFDVKKGEVLALAGENGAGKSTLMKILSGSYTRDCGTIEFCGKPAEIHNPRDAEHLGLSIIYQELNVLQGLSVAENIFIGRQPKKKNGLIDWAKMNKDAEELFQQLHIEMDVRRKVLGMSIAQQQMVEIAKALSTNAKIIILDEPTAALTANESEKLYRIVDQLREEGVSIIFISHRMEDMYRLASRVTVFRDSQYIGTYDVDKITEADLIKAMVGREISDMYPKPEVKIGDEVFRIEGMSRTGYFKDVSLNIHAGEIVGLTGLVGAGRTETMEAVCGITKPDAGKVFVNGKEVHIKNPADAMKEGIVLLPEDRQKQGLILSWGLGDNVILPVQDELAKGPFKVKNEPKERELAKKYLEEVDTKAVTIFDPGSSLSGGNQQKVVVAKALVQDNMKVLIMDEPTKGVDVGAKAEIYSIMGDLAKKGYAILLISSEMAEILGMSDRIYTMCKGRITGCLDINEASQESLLELSMENSRTTGKEAVK